MHYTLKRRFTPQIEGFINTILCSTEVVGHPVRMTHKLCDGKTIMSCAMLKQEAVKKGTKISNCELIEDNPFKGAGGVPWVQIMEKSLSA